jgi:Mn-dependent DtxR family transcriptional regulator
MKEMSKFDEAIYILIVDLISRKQQFDANNVNLDEITETVKDNIRASLNKLYLQQLIEVDSQKNITLTQKNKQILCY